MTGVEDPFGTAALRSGVLDAWRGSPTRLREDGAVEADLVRAGYRDRLLTELAQNAADAAAKAGVAGRLAVWFAGDAVHLANTGVPLDISGVHSLTALRASAKSGVESTVGQFGVGFTAVLSVGDEIEFRSRTGSLRFSREGTGEELRRAGIAIPEQPGFAPPALRLTWAIETGPADGFDSEIVVRLRAGIDAVELSAAMRAEAGDLLLELPALQYIRIGDDEIRSDVADLDNGLRQVRVSDPIHGTRTWWQFQAGRSRWLLPVVNGRPVAAEPDVLRAPTRSDEELSLPALLIADIPMQPDRRRLLPGARIAELAAGYADFARALPPQERLVLVPTPGFPRSETDALLREALITELRAQAWLPVVPGSADAAEAAVTPQRANVFLGATGELAHHLAEVLGPLVIPELSGHKTSDALTVLDVHRIGLARIAEVSANLEFPPEWWYSLYDALEPFAQDRLAAEELGAIAVPLADGRRVTGPRTAVLSDDLELSGAFADPETTPDDLPEFETPTLPVHWARLVHPEAAHTLLERLGARQATVEDLLGDPALQALLEDDPADSDTVDAVLRLAGQLRGSLPTWLGMLELPDESGELRPADELLLPDAPLARVMVSDESPFGTVDSAIVRRYGAEALRAIGVGWGFSVVTEPDPTGPDHNLDDEEAWWDTLQQDPPELAAVRDLDLVAQDAWPEALRLLLSEPSTRRLLADRDGYTAWWLRRHARLDGIALGLFRAPGDPVFAELLPEPTSLAPDELNALRAVLADPETITQELATALLDALADPAKTPSPESIAQTHSLLAESLDLLDLDELALPERVRALSGAVIDPADALVLDEPCFGLAVPPDRLVVGDPATARELATLLDLRLVSEVVTAEVLGAGRVSTWSAEPLGVVLRPQFGESDGELVLHDRLRVNLRGAFETTAEVSWWRDGSTTHVQAQPISRTT
ncbi:sacsin N-terminal ATP-binding-like domain-containing protein [Nocardia alni]|uniref:sacsin N-terminal ATP-binding-like domain-containing protein n=1 Tax=Nocardia alni TaxID=2815723 RepID=UPI001C21E480|nr:ATP-binding protein [Nocardia alni]